MPSSSFAPPSQREITAKNSNSKRSSFPGSDQVEPKRTAYSLTQAPALLQALG
jgi:hypothetical protein